MHHIYHYLGMAVFWTAIPFATGCAVVAWRERHKRAAVIHEGKVVLDPFTANQTRALVLRYRGVGSE